MKDNETPVRLQPDIINCTFSAVVSGFSAACQEIPSPVPLTHHLLCPKSPGEPLFFNPTT